MVGKHSEALRAGGRLTDDIVEGVLLSAKHCGTDLDYPLLPFERFISMVRIWVGGRFGGVEGCADASKQRHVRSSPLNLCLNLKMARERHVVAAFLTAPFQDCNSRLP